MRGPDAQERFWQAVGHFEYSQNVERQQREKYMAEHPDAVEPLPLSVTTFYQCWALGENLWGHPAPPLVDNQKEAYDLVFGQPQDQSSSDPPAIKSDIKKEHAPKSHPYARTQPTRHNRFTLSPVLEPGIMEPTTIESIMGQWNPFSPEESTASDSQAGSSAQAAENNLEKSPPSASENDVNTDEDKKCKKEHK